MLSSRQFVRDPQPGQEVVGYYADKATKARQRLRRRSPGRKASEGMTSAIILIAFIITAAGVAFVILTMGSSMQQQLGATGRTWVRTILLRDAKPSLSTNPSGGNTITGSLKWKVDW